MINFKKTAITGNNPQQIAQSNLGDKIDELENLINSAQKDQGNIPVLDDLVIPEQGYSMHTAESSFSPEQMSELANTIDEKLSEELNSLLDLLKDTIKDSILEEINTQLYQTGKNPDQTGRK